jgi:hypothetical protein
VSDEAGSVNEAVSTRRVLYNARRDERAERSDETEVQCHQRTAIVNGKATI